MVVVVLALVTIGWTVLRGYAAQDQAAPWAAASQADAAQLQALASAACLCTRAKGTGAESTCWKDFKAVAPGPSKGGDVTACAPVSTETGCFSTAAGEVCIVTGYDVNGVSDPGLDTRLCTAAEAHAVESALQQAWRGPDGKDPDPDDKADSDAANKRANAAINRVVRRIMNGETIAATGPASEGCTG
jgi:hypothetical protein